MPSPLRLSAPNRSPITQLAAAFGSRALSGDLLEIFGGRALGDEHLGILSREPVIAR